MKRWQIQSHYPSGITLAHEEVMKLLLQNRGISDKVLEEYFLSPPHPATLSSADVDIDQEALSVATTRIIRAIKNKEKIVVYADYDADGVTGGAIMVEGLSALGADVTAYIPHRVEEGYGFSLKGIDAVIEKINPNLIISVDHGITAHEKVAYIKQRGIDVVVTDHHVMPSKLPECPIVHTTKLCGAGVAWFVVKELFKNFDPSAVSFEKIQNELLALAAIGSIADMVPLTGATRSIVKYGLAELNKTQRLGLLALIKNAGITGALSCYHISHQVAPRINAMGRLTHALDALELLCCKDTQVAQNLAQLLSETNRDRQVLTDDTITHAQGLVTQNGNKGAKLLVIASEEYNPGVIGLVAGKLVESHYRPAVVISKGEKISKASARSIAGFNLIEAIRLCSDLLIDAGGHPMAAGFTIETDKIEQFRQKLQALAETLIPDELLTRVQSIDLSLPLGVLSEKFWQTLRLLEPFGVGSPEPIFASERLRVLDARLLGKDMKHLKLKVAASVGPVFEAIGFGMGNLYKEVLASQRLDLAYALDMNEWNGRRNLQLKIKDIRFG